MTNQRPQRTDGLTPRSKWYGDASIGPRCVGATVAIAVGAAQDPESRVSRKYRQVGHSHVDVDDKKVQACAILFYIPL